MTGLEIDEGTCPYITSVGASESVILLRKTASAPTKLEKLLNMPATKRILLSPWLIAALVLSSTVAYAAEPKVILLWPNGAPGSAGKTAEEKVRMSPEGDRVVSSAHHPSITVYLPSKDNATGAAVVVVPGGGHRELWMDHEGYRIGQWLSDRGVAGFVVKYRLAKEPGSTYTIEGHSFADVQRAIRLVRKHAL